nr:MAG TPA: hypothetical protein [Bacteriophage sp.]
MIENIKHLEKSKCFSYTLTVWNPVRFLYCPNRAEDVKSCMSSRGLLVKA